MAGLTVEKVGSLTVLDLRKELKKAGLDSKGNKAVLVERLKGHVETAGADTNGADTNGNGESVKPEEKKAEPEVAAAVPEVPAAAEKEGDGEKKDGEGTADTDKQEDNPLSEERMKRRAERFGLPWPREEGAKRPKLSGNKKTKENAISAFVLTSDEISQREARAKRFGNTPTAAEPAVGATMESK